MSLSSKDRKVLLAACARLARMVERAADVSTDASRRLADLRKTIREQEKGHRNFAPVGWRHKFSVDQAVDYFIVKTVAEAREDMTAKDLARLRNDYVKATFLVCDDDFKRRLDEQVGASWAMPGKTWQDVFKVMAAVDYAALSGSSERVDSETNTAIMWAREHG